MELKFRVQFDGLDAEQNRLEAYPAAQSMEGLSWAMSIVLHYGITGELRSRGDLSRSAKLFVTPARRGSYYQDIVVILNNHPFIAGLIGGYAVNTVTPMINGLVAYTFNQAIGAARALPRGAGRYIRKLNGDDLEDLAVRIEPPLTRAHAAIGRTASTIEFKSKRTSLVSMNTETKRYLEAQMSGDFETVDTNVTSFNILTGNGRLYFPETDSTVPFSLHSEPHRGTKQALIHSMENYAIGHAGTIRLTAKRFETVDGRMKKLVVTGAEEIPRSDWIDGADPLRRPR